MSRHPMRSKPALLAILFTTGTLWAGLTWAQVTGDSSNGSAGAEAKPKATEYRTVGTPEPLTYTLGPDDVIQIDVAKHPEFSGEFVVGRSGKIQYKYVGDIDVQGLTKTQLAEKLQGQLGQYVVEPEVIVTISAFRSKVIYVVGEVGRPGRYYLQGESVPVREVIFEAGLPTLASSMRRTQIIHAPSPEIPMEKVQPKDIKMENLNLYALVYLGDVSKNVSLHTGDILYVPSTVFHKASRILDPVLDPVYKAAVARRIAE